VSQFFCFMWSYTLICKYNYSSFFKYISPPIALLVLRNNIFKSFKSSKVQLTAHQTIHIGLCTALNTRASALRSNCKYIARRAVDRTVNSTSDYTHRTLYRSYFQGFSANIEIQVYSVYSVCSVCVYSVYMYSVTCC
jgi:hypothetical protein